MGGAGSVIISGLYWRRGTTAGAWTALSCGTIFGFGGMLVQQIWKPFLAPMMLNLRPDWAWLATHQDKFPVNGQIIFFFAMVLSLLSYILVSLLGPKQAFDMDRMLHRGKYAVKTGVAFGDDEPVTKPRRTFSSLIVVRPSSNLNTLHSQSISHIIQK